ncbi:glycosyltransferase [Microvirga terrae]|uniref:Glycosyltransferase n=1 Tax=Microvirga terrae TaxID=2740529 RepID=A0ABY5RMF1_9HYPH|nr:glycosyltransferase [Microvirga terrae]UVF18408.1 glycosyltransferase [Microvirga terrae]
MTSAVSIGITTYNRPEQLGLLLSALDRQVLPHDLESRIKVVLVDNSPDCTARNVAESYCHTGRFPLKYISEPLKGLSKARNAALATALPDSEFITFIDDDEVPTSSWLAALVGKLIESNAAAVVGPVQPIFEGVAPTWISGGQYFSKNLAVECGFVREGYTCNTALRASVLRKLNLWFDEAFDQTGGEDTMFFDALKKAGEQIAWAEDALVLEWIPKSRTNLSWMARRWYRTGGTEANLGRFRPLGVAGRTVNFLRGCVRVGIGALLLLLCAPWFWFRRGMVVRVLTMICRGAGLVSSAFGKQHQEYAHPAYH